MLTMHHTKFYSFHVLRFHMFIQRTFMFTPQYILECTLYCQYHYVTCIEVTTNNNIFIYIFIPLNYVL